MVLMPANTGWASVFILKSLGVRWMQGDPGLHLCKKEFIYLVCANYSQEASKKVYKLA